MQVSDTNALLTKMAKTFKFFVNYLKESFPNQRLASLSIAPVITSQVTRKLAFTIPIVTIPMALTFSHI